MNSVNATSHVELVFRRIRGKNEMSQSRRFCLIPNEPTLKIAILNSDRDSFTIGRSVNCTLTFKDVEIDETHAVFQKPWSRPEWYVKNVSTLPGLSGVYVNRVNLEAGKRCLLKEGDSIAIGYSNGAYQFRYCEYVAGRTKKHSKEKSPTNEGNVEMVIKRKLINRQLNLEADVLELRQLLLKERDRVNALQRVNEVANETTEYLLDGRHAEIRHAKLKCDHLEIATNREMDTILEATTQCQIENEKEIRGLKEQVEEYQKRESRYGDLERKLMASRSKTRLLEEKISQEKSTALDTWRKYQDSEKELYQLRKAALGFDTSFCKGLIEELTCSICVDIFRQAVTLNCGHSFCHDCIADWSKTKNECPTCRGLIESRVKDLTLNAVVGRVKDLTAESTHFKS